MSGKNNGKHGLLDNQDDRIHSTKEVPLMAEFCKDCFLKINPLGEDETVVLSAPNDLDFCEGCGQWKRVVVRIRRKNIFDRLKERSRN